MPPGAHAARDAFRSASIRAGTIMFSPTFLLTDSTSDPVGGTMSTTVTTSSRPAPGRSIRSILRSASASSTSAYPRSAATSSGAAGSIVTDDGAIRVDRGHGPGREPRHRGAPAHGAPAQRRLLRRRQASRSSRSRARRSSRATTTRCASPATSRSAARRARSSSTPRSRAPATAPYGTTRVGIAATGAIDRSDWGITWNAPLANGAFAVGERVKLTLHVEAVLKA